MSYLNERQPIEESYISPTFTSYTFCKVIIVLWHIIPPGFGQITQAAIRASFPEVIFVVSEEMDHSGLSLGYKHAVTHIGNFLLLFPDRGENIKRKPLNHLSSCGKIYDLYS